MGLARLLLFLMKVLKSISAYSSNRYKTPSRLFQVLVEEEEEEKGGGGGGGGEEEEEEKVEGRRG